MQSLVFILLSVERAESKKKSASGRYHTDGKAHPLSIVFVTLVAGLIISRTIFFIARRVELFCLVGVSGTRQRSFFSAHSAVNKIKCGFAARI
jgi:hypothetical protein